MCKRLIIFPLLGGTRGKGLYRSYFKIGLAFKDMGIWELNILPLLGGVRGGTN